MKKTLDIMSEVKSDDNRSARALPASWRAEPKEFGGVKPLRLLSMRTAAVLVKASVWCA
eukprot:CAMPEP_0202071262 /NCGR_PEP_ID=MMETSP0964-20121228/1693_1 /ASSEMBLY_ACC=CAM_ASM_000500 /TAXON_ID=4773 /ORGANISM="Schizochytrium aggregatum, Strain ATCC28209" /LENGTH=58 /DNA_ID=CAMNT_0048638209 /DNA_START=12 /DNA_END=187 /DNA_ORIENTATION=-